jgi:hypothetical protein
MAGPLSKPAATTAGGDSFRIWAKDRQRVEQDIVEGRPFDAFVTERGRFDIMFDFMLQSGLWTAATGMRPSGLKKNNGISYRLLNGVECLREMAGIDAPANCGPLLKDAYLLERIGFTAEKIQRRLRNDQTVIDPESLLNHLGRFAERDLEAGFQQHLEVIRRKRWLRGGVYAVDGHDIVIPYGQGYEGAHHISGGAYGYKLLVLLNVQDDCELIVGYILGSLQESEITMLRRLLARLNRAMGPLRQWLKILLMDRGYWGTDLFCELKQDYGIDFVSRVRDEKMDVNGLIQRQLEEADRSWSSFAEQRQFSGRKQTQQVRVTALRPIQLISDEKPYREIAVNIVVAIQSHANGAPIRDKKGKDISRSDYITSLAPGRHGVKVRGFYRRRWGIGVSSQGHILQPVRDRPGPKDSGLVAWEAPWRESKTAEPSDNILGKECAQRTRLQRAVNADVASLHESPVAETVYNARKQQGLAETSPIRQLSPAGYQRRHGVKEDVETGEALGARRRNLVEGMPAITVSGKCWHRHQGGGSGRSTVDGRAAKRARREGPGPVSIPSGKARQG